MADEIKDQQDVADVKPVIADSGVLVDLEAVDPLAIGRKFKKIGEFVVDAAFDPTLSPQFKDLNNKFIANQQVAEKERAETAEKLAELSGKLMNKKDLDAAEKDRLEKALSDMTTKIALAEKDAHSAQVDLLKVHTASAMGLPHHFIAYVVGDTPEAIKASVEKVLTDFNLQKTKFTQEELNAAAALAATKAKAETEEALRIRGINTEGAVGDGRVFTRAEIRGMSISEYKANRSKITDQESKGLIH